MVRELGPGGCAGHLSGREPCRRLNRGSRPTTRNETVFPRRILNGKGTVLAIIQGHACESGPVSRAAVALTA
eukprot:scaffold1711_cov258-Prasinococcus_capsulatus_cf.AAC.2